MQVFIYFCKKKADLICVYQKNVVPLPSQYGETRKLCYTT